MLRNTVIFINYFLYLTYLNAIKLIKKQLLTYKNLKVIVLFRININNIIFASEFWPIPQGLYPISLITLRVKYNE